MSVQEVKDKNKMGLEFPMSSIEMILEVASLLCIVISLAILGINMNEITIGNIVLPAISIFSYLLLSLAARYPGYFRRINEMASYDSMNQDRGTREIIFLARTEILWTVLCIQAIITSSSMMTEGIGRTIIMILFGITWLIINGSLLFFMMRIPRQRSL